MVNNKVIYPYKKKKGESDLFEVCEHLQYKHSSFEDLTVVDVTVGLGKEDR